MAFRSFFSKFLDRDVIWATVSLASAIGVSIFVAVDFRDRDQRQQEQQAARVTLLLVSLDERYMAEVDNRQALDVRDVSVAQGPVDFVFLDASPVIHWYRFCVPADADYVIDVRSDGGDPYFRLYDSDFSYLDYGDDRNSSTDARVEYYFEADRDYYVGVLNLSDQEGSYSVSIERVDASNGVTRLLSPRCRRSDRLLDPSRGVMEARCHLDRKEIT